MTKLRTWRCLSVVMVLMLTLGVCAMVVPTSPVMAAAAAATWDIQTVDDVPAMATSLALDSNGYPHISYTTAVLNSGAHNSLHYARWTGTAWAKEMVDDVPAMATSLALDSNNRPHISYTTGGLNSLHYARWTGTAWAKETVDGGGVSDCSLALDSNNRPHISYASWGSGLLYARWTGTAWAKETVDEGDVLFNSLALDSNNRPHISYSTGGLTLTSLHYARWTGTAWAKETVDEGDVFFNSLALDSNNRPHISYYDASNGDLKYAKFISPDITVAPTSIDFGSVQVGSSSTQTVTVTNDGTANLNVGTISLGGANADQFAIHNDNCSGQALAPGASATVQVVFSPTSAGAKTATLSIPSNDPDENPVNVALNGTGIQQTQQVSTATGTGTGTFTTGSGSVTGLTAVAEATLPAAGKPAGVTFPHGFFSFNITNITPGSCGTVTITWPSAVAVGTTYWKYHASEGGWIQIPMGSDDGDNVTTITLCDGGLGDDDGVANGTIVDPGGPGVVIVGTVAAPAMPDGASTGGPAPARVTEPDLRPKYLSVNPKQVYANQPVNILTNVVNRGNMAGSYMVNLLINGQVEQRKTVSVSAGGTQPVRFTVTKAQPGTYTVAVGGDRARFTVIGAGLERSVGSANGPAVGLATFLLVLVAGLLLLVVRKRFQAG